MDFVSTSELMHLKYAKSDLKYLVNFLLPVNKAKMQMARLTKKHELDFSFSSKIIGESPAAASK